MVIFTNNHELPDYLQAWLMHDEYDYHEGVISATGLLGAPRQQILKQRHFDDIEIDLEDMIARVFGTAIHDSFEKVEMPRIAKEERVLCVVGGKRISGKYDMLKTTGSTHKIIDIKTTSAWNFIYGSSAEHWKLQLSIYRYILKKNGLKLEDGEWVDRKAIDVSKKAEICFVFTDWKRSDARKGGNYPPIRVGYNHITLYGMKTIGAYIRERLKVIEEADQFSDDELPFCTEEELWKGKDKFAVMKKGRKSAVRVFDSRDEAEALIIEKDDKHYIDVRKGLYGACNYCDVRTVCNQCEQIIKDKMLKDYDYSKEEEEVAA